MKPKFIISKKKNWHLKKYLQKYHQENHNCKANKLM
jgi:hypothetical protein